MKKSSKVIILVLCISLVLIGGVYATLKIIEKAQGQAQLAPTFTQSIGDNDINSIWVGAFQIAWNEFMDTRVKESVEFEDGESELAIELNKRMFTKDMLSSEDYYIKIGETSNKLKSEIESDIKERFGIENSSALDQINFDVDEKSKSCTIYSVLYKNFKFLTPFDRLYATPFNESEEVVRYFGINNASSEDLNKNVKVLFYNDRTDFAVSLKTIENEDVILYCNDSNSSFNDLYNEVKSKANAYKGNRNFKKNDLLTVPYINIDTIINYGELCGREIKGTDGLYISNAIQNVKFSLDETGGNLVSEAGIKDEYQSFSDEARYFCLNKPFILFLKESDKDLPYFALKVDNTDILVKSSKEENKQILN